MRINTRFSIAVHIMALLALQGETIATSEMMAMSVGNHPVAVRQIMSSLKKAGLIQTQNGVPGGHLTKTPEKITLCDIYRAVRTSEDALIFDLHQNPNPECPVGSNIKTALYEPLLYAQNAMENALEDRTLKDITAFILEKHNKNI